MEKRFSTTPASSLFNRYVLIALLIVLLLAAWGKQYVVVLLIGLTISASGLSRLWSLWSLKKVDCRRELNELYAFPGDYIQMKMRLENRKLLPLPWVQVDIEIPAGFAPESSTVESRPGRRLISRSTALLWYSAYTWRQQLFCHKRGYFQFGKNVVTTGDMFGFFPRSRSDQQEEYITVFPRVFPISRLNIPPLFPMGDSLVKPRIFEDPTRISGVRNYCPGDSLRWINWKATARRQELQVKVFEPSTTLDVAIFLPVDTFRIEGSLSEDNFEMGISVAASLAADINEHHCSTGLFVNSTMADGSDSVRIQPGSGLNQLTAILNSLAKVTGNSSDNFFDFFNNEKKRLPCGISLIFIIGKASDAFVNFTNDLESFGDKVKVFQIGDTTGPENWQKISSSGDFLKSEALP